MAKRIQRALPIAGARLHVEQGVDAPGKLRVAFHHLLGDHPRGGGVIAALRLEIKAAQAEELGLGPIEHAFEGAPRRGTIALELGRLRLEQSGQGLVGEIAPRHAGIALRLGAVADADGEQAPRQRFETLAAAALLKVGGHRRRAGEDEA